MSFSASSGLIGRPLTRKEDHRLLIGEGSFSDDVNFENQAYLAVVRSQHAHARIRAIDKGEALAIPGVLAVLSGEDLEKDGLKPIPHVARFPLSPPDIALKNSDGSEIFISPHYPLPRDKVRFVGEAVAIVVAETADGARTAAECVMIDYDVLEAVVGGTAAAGADAPLVWEDAGSNVCLDATVGDSAATDAAFARATYVVSLETWIQRVTGFPLEPRSVVASYDETAKRYTIHAGSSGVFRHRDELAVVLGVEGDDVRILARDVGGNFGTRNAVYPEFALAAWAARRTGRAVKWTCDRREAFLSDYQGRDLLADAALALDDCGKILGLRASLTSNLGAHAISFIQIFKATSLITGVYAVPALHVRARAVLSNTPPTHPYRSTGRPEAMYVIERLIDLASYHYGFDRIVLRRRNLVAETALPYTTRTGLTFDSGDYEHAMDRALALIDYQGFAERRRKAIRNGICLGIGVSNYIEITSGNPREFTRITVRPDNHVDVAIGTMSSGQGHETSFAQVAADSLGVPFENINLLTGDTDLIPTGGGSHSGRSMRFAGIVIGKAANALIAKGKPVAAAILEADPADIEFKDGRYFISNSNRGMHLFDVARKFAMTGEVFFTECDETILTAAFPYGCHACEIAIDPETGAATIEKYAAVDDVGRAINPLILHGQTHGGVVQGLGQALREQCFYDPESGELLTASMMDYGLLRAADVPFFDAELSEYPATSNPLGIRAGGEGGVTPSLAAVGNAITDALKELGVRHVEMPASPQRIWKAIADVAADGRKSPWLSSVSQSKKLWTSGSSSH